MCDCLLTAVTTTDRQERFCDFFTLPPGQQCLIELNANFHLKGHEDIYAGKVYLSQDFIAFASLDRRSCILALPLATIKRVERVGGLGHMYALAVELWEGNKIVLSPIPTPQGECLFWLMGKARDRTSN